MKESMSQGLLILIASPSLEEALVDLLLGVPEISGFTSSIVYGHGAKNHVLSLMEQVTGRQQRIQFMIYGEMRHLNDLLRGIHSNLMHADIRTILLPTANIEMS